MTSSIAATAQGLNDLLIFLHSFVPHYRNGSPVNMKFALYFAWQKRQLHACAQICFASWKVQSFQKLKTLAAHQVQPSPLAHLKPFTIFRSSPKNMEWSIREAKLLGFNTAQPWILPCQTYAVTFLSVEINVYQIAIQFIIKNLLKEKSSSLFESHGRKHVLR